MSSEAITRNDLKAILNEILPQDHYIQSWESVGDVYWGTGTWTVPDDGFLLIYANPSTAPWYYRISDSGVPDGGWSHRLGSNYAVSQSYVCFVKKGMVLKDHSKNNISSINAYYFKFTLKNTSPSSSADYSDKTYSANGTLRVVRTSNAVQVIYSGNAISYTKNAYTLIYTLGENERPAGPVYFTAYNNETNNIAMVPLVGYIDTLGRIYIWVYSGISGNVAPRFSVTFLKE